MLVITPVGMALTYLMPTEPWTWVFFAHICLLWYQCDGPRYTWNQWQPLHTVTYYITLDNVSKGETVNVCQWAANGAQ